jgi:hypothetical protein
MHISNIGGPQQQMFHRRSTNNEQVSTTNRLIMAAAANGGGVAGADEARTRQKSVFGVGGSKIDGNYATASNAMRRDPTSNSS